MFKSYNTGKIKLFLFAAVALMVCSVGFLSAAGNRHRENFRDTMVTIETGGEEYRFDTYDMTPEELTAQMQDIYSKASAGWNYMVVGLTTSGVTDFLNDNGIDPTNVKIIITNYSQVLYYYVPQ